MQTKPFLILLGVVVVFFAFNVASLVGKMRDTIKNRKIAEEKVVELQQRKEKLEADIKKLGTEKGKEEIFRENFGLSKNGEGMIMVVEDNNKKPTEATEKSGGFFSFFKKLFR